MVITSVLSHSTWPIRSSGGLVASGQGYCLDAEAGRKIQLQPGTVWAIPKDALHSFHTDQSLEDLAEPKNIFLDFLVPKFCETVAD